MKKLITGYILVGIAIFLMFFVWYKNSKFSQKVPSFSSYTFLSSSWERYKQQFVNSDGRVLDHSQNDITTSEGQSYAMLRSVWVDDHDSFDKAWNWTNNVLKRPKDNLFGWRWGMRNDGKYGFIENGGDNSASDADSDIALSLILAYRRWGDKKYEVSAQKILTDMWDIETASVSGKRYLVAGNWAKSSDRLFINPSYFAPYAWRIFATVDTKHDWKGLITPSYTLLNDASTLPLDKDKGVGFPPDWVALTLDGIYLAPNLSNLTTNYSLDAMRIPWRIAIDYRWNNNQEAKKYLTRMCSFIIEKYKKERQLGSSYSHNGEELNASESPAFYGANLPCFEILNKDLADSLYQNKIEGLYSNATNSFNSDLSYYDQNWLWFAAAFHYGRIDDFK